MNRVHYEVSGLANSESKTKIKNALDKLESVQMANVDLARATIEVGYNVPADECQIKNCIEKTGYKIL